MQIDILDLLLKIKELDEENARLNERTAFLEKACAYWQFLSREQGEELRKKVDDV